MMLLNADKSKSTSVIKAWDILKEGDIRYRQNAGILEHVYISICAEDKVEKIVVDLHWQQFGSN